MASGVLFSPRLLPPLSSSSSPSTVTARCPVPPPQLLLRRAGGGFRRRFSSSDTNNSEKDDDDDATGRVGGFADQILDYIEGGPKMRRWYGGSPGLLPRDAGERQEDDRSSSADDVDEDRDAILVTNGDSEIGQMVILSLILKRARIKAVVKDKRAAIDAFGTYVEAVAADSGKLPFIRALRGVRAIICPSNEGFLSSIGQMKGIQHIVLLSQLGAYRGSSGIQALVNAKARKLAEEDEKSVMNSGIPYTIIRSGLLQGSPGGKEGFSFKEGVAATGKLSKEDASRICVEALDVIPQKSLIVEVASGEEKISDWRQWFSSLAKNEG